MSAARPAKASKKSPASSPRKKAAARPSGDSEAQGTDSVPKRDHEALNRVIPRIEIEDVELLGAHFVRQDEGPLPISRPRDVPDQIGIGVEWKVNEDGSRLGCVITFGTFFAEGADAPYDVIARFRLVYSVSPGPSLPAQDYEQFAYWNAVYNAYPYWREFLSNMIERAHLDRFVAPVMRMPSSKTADR